MPADRSNHNISRRSVMVGLAGAGASSPLSAALASKQIEQASYEVYEQISDGMANTNNGEHFVIWQRRATEAVLYLNNGTAAERGRIPIRRQLLQEVDTLDDLRGTDVSIGHALFDGAIFSWHTEDAPYDADRFSAVESLHYPLSVGAWIKQRASKIMFVRRGDETFARDLNDKLEDEVSILDYIPQHEHDHIRAGTSTYDCAEAFQRAISDCKTLIVPNGIYNVGKTIREATNAGARSIIGRNRLHTKIVATRELAARGEPIFWFGNSSGHGNYRLRFQHISLNGAGQGQQSGAIGIRLHECGTSVVGDLYITRCKIAIDAIGCISCSFGGEKTEIFACVKGIWHSNPLAGKPGSQDDQSRTASSLSLKDNANRMSNIWFSRVTKPIRICGGLSHLEHTVLQNCGDGGTDDLIHLLNANESYDYGGGPTISDLWCEGGSYRSIIRVEKTRDARIRKVFLSGSGKNGEQGIVIARSSGCRVDDVAARGYWSRQPSEKRGGNYWLHVGLDSPNGVFGPFYFTQNSCNYYIDRTSAQHNHIIIDNHRANNSNNGVIIGPVQIVGGVIQKDPALEAQTNLHIKDFAFLGAIRAESEGDDHGVFDAEVEFRVNNQKVLGARSGPISDPRGGENIDKEARSAIATLLAALRGHGLIS